MTKAARLAFISARNEASKYGATVQFEEAGRHGHPKLYITLNGKLRRIGLSDTPGSMTNQANQIKQEIRREIRVLAA